MWTVRACEERDWEAVVRIHNAIQPEPTNAEQMRRSDEAIRSQGGSLERVVAEEGGQVVGYGFAEHAPWMPENRWTLKAMVHPSARGRGAGKAIYARVKQIADGQGARSYEAWVRGEDEDSFAWAQRRGFVLDRERTESVLDLTRFDPSRFAGAIERVEAGGLRVAATTRVDEDLLRRLWELDCAVTPDIPIWDPDEKLPSFEEFKRFWEEEPAERMLVGCFDGERLVGASTIWFPVVEGGGAYTGFTGVLREYRGRGIALAVKLPTITEAIRRGITRMRTNNDPDNPPMLAVNEKLGYRLVPGPRRLRMGE
ncbi:MAG: GNAT family N-acetyltransferase [Bacillota bacterium]